MNAYFDTVSVRTPYREITRKFKWAVGLSVPQTHADLEMKYAIMRDAILKDVKVVVCPCCNTTVLTLDLMADTKRGVYGCCLCEGEGEKK